VLVTLGAIGGAQNIPTESSTRPGITEINVTESWTHHSGKSRNSIYTHLVVCFRLFLISVKHEGPMKLAVAMARGLSDTPSLNNLL